MAMIARFETANDLPNRRGAARKPLRLQVSGGSIDVSGSDVLIHDLSRTGLLIETRSALTVGTEIEVDLPEAHNTAARISWRTGRYFGCEFKSPLPVAAVSAALLKNPSKSRPNSQFAAPTAEPIEATEENPVAGLPLVSRIRIIFALAVSTWAAVFLVVAVGQAAV